MKLTKRNRRTARKLAFPVIALAMMTSTMLAMGSSSAPASRDARSVPAGAAARVPHDLPRR